MSVLDGTKRNVCNLLANTDAHPADTRAAPVCAVAPSGPGVTSRGRWPLRRRARAKAGSRRQLRTLVEERRAGPRASALLLFPTAGNQPGGGSHGGDAEPGRTACAEKRGPAGCSGLLTTRRPTPAVLGREPASAPPTPKPLSPLNRLRRPAPGPASSGSSFPDACLTPAPLAPAVLGARCGGVRSDPRAFAHPLPPPTILLPPDTHLPDRVFF